MAFVAVVIRTAWVCDDAYIAFRTVDNLVNGLGLRWNPSERVQAFTSPLWVLLLSPLYALSREIYYTSLASSLVLSAFVVLLVRRLVNGPWAAVGALTVLVFSKAFIDYSTSGLECPLLHVALMLFLLAYLRLAADPSAKRLIRICFSTNPGTFVS